MEGFPFSIPDLAGLGGIIALVSLFGWMLGTGRLWTKGQVDTVMTLRQEATEAQRIRADEWKAAAETSAAQVTTLAEASGITADFLRKADAVREEADHATP